MATDVRMMMQMMSNRFKERERDGERKRADLVTRDFLDAMSGDPRHRCHYRPLQHQQIYQQPPNLDLNLFTPKPTPVAAATGYATVCTLDKVKSALERADRKKQQQSKAVGLQPGEEGMVVAGCPGCLLYVLVSRLRPRCPRCEAPVPLPERKKARFDFDLNSTIF